MAQRCHALNCTKPAVSKGLCDTHRKRRDRHGHIEPTRPADWGSREKHPCYGTWAWLRRSHSTNMPKHWHDDFWAFLSEVPERPEGKATATRPDESKPWGPDNFYWKEPRFSVEQLADRAAYQREWQRSMRAADPDYFKNKDLKRTYGVTLDWYNEQLEKQNHACAICKQPEIMEINGKLVRLAVDHCHDTGKVRGLLCTACNRAIGLLKHDQTLIGNAWLYLEETE